MMRLCADISGALETMCIFQLASLASGCDNVQIGSKHERFEVKSVVLFNSTLFAKCNLHLSRLADSNIYAIYLYSSVFLCIIAL